MDPYSIIRAPEALSETHVPGTLPGREESLKELFLLLSMKGPNHVWMFGPPGSGKSSVARKALGHLEEERVKTALVNCWSAQTFSAVIEAVFQELRALVDERRDTAFKLDRLGRVAREERVVIVLDEVDQMPLQERNAALYNLSRLGKVNLICISASREAYLAMDPRVRSRILPHFLEFTPYSGEQLQRILRDRAERGLTPESWCENDLVAVADESRGDARIAIQTLRTAVYRAEKKRVPQITPDDIEEGLRQSSELRRRYAIRQLSDHQKLLYQIVEEAGKIETGRAWRAWVARSKEKGLAPLKRRTFQHQKKRLVQQQLLQEFQERGRGNRIFLRVRE